MLWNFILRSVNCFSSLTNGFHIRKLDSVYDISYFRTIISRTLEIFNSCSHLCTQLCLDGHNQDRGEQHPSQLLWCIVLLTENKGQYIRPSIFSFPYVQGVLSFLSGFFKVQMCHSSLVHYFIIVREWSETVS